MVDSGVTLRCRPLLVRLEEYPYTAAGVITVTGKLLLTPQAIPTDSFVMYRLATSVARLAYNLDRSYLLLSQVQTMPTIYIAAGSLQYQVNVGVKKLILILQL